MRLVLFLLAVVLPSVQGWRIHISPPVEQLSTRMSGTNLMVVCNVEELEADQTDDVNVDWFKHGQERAVGKLGRIMTIAKGKAPSKQLMFVRPSVEDSGEYKCVATVDGASQEKTLDISFIQAAEFVDVQREQHPEQEKDAEIVCRVKGHPSLEIFWQFNGNNVVEGGPRGYEFKDNNQVLLIPKFMSENDDGEYSCSAAQFSSFETIVINVSAYARPAITVFEGPESNRGSEGQSVRIQCQAVGKPKPEYNWTKNTEGTEEPIGPSDKYSVNGGLLEIHSLIPVDAGTYKCIAWNALDQSERELSLSVFRKPKIERMSNETRARGESVEFRCAYSGDGKVTAKWVFQGEELFAPNPAAEKSHDVTEGNEDGSDNEAPESTTASPAESAEEDEDGGNAYEDSETKRKDDDEEGGENAKRRKREESRFTVRKEEGALILRISPVAEEDAGQFLCVAENEAGTDRRSAFLAITHPPTITGHSEMQRIVLESPMELSCEASAVPDPEWAWTGPQGVVEADGSKFIIDSISSTSKLTITKTEEDDFGKYSCSADNKIGSPDQAEIEVIQIFIPEKPSEVTCHGYVYPNFGMCRVDSYNEVDEGRRPTHLVFFYARNLDITSDFDWETDAENVTRKFGGDEYRIDALQPKSRYSVRVRAFNEAGSSELSDADFIETTDPRAPEKMLDVQHDCSRMCTVSWNEPNDQGSPITSYRVVVRELLQEEPRTYVDDGHQWEFGPDESKIDLSSLKPLTAYEVTLVALNEVGSSDPHSLVLKTSEFSGDGRDLASLSSMRIMLAAGFVLLFVLLVIDLICFATNRCGLLACFCINCLGRNVHAGKGKDVEQGQGNRSESNRLLGEGKAEAGISGRHDKGVLLGVEGPQSTSV